jgi:hypothetical protein
VYEWTSEAAERLAAAIGEDAAAYHLSETDIEVLLSLARVAAHESGVKSNAPLICFLVGLAHSRHPGRRLEELVEHATGAAGER